MTSSVLMSRHLTFGPKTKKIRNSIKKKGMRKKRKNDRENKTERERETVQGLETEKGRFFFLPFCSTLKSTKIMDQNMDFFLHFYFCQIDVKILGKVLVLKNFQEF